MVIKYLKAAPRVKAKIGRWRHGSACSKPSVDFLRRHQLSLNGHIHPEHCFTASWRFPNSDFHHFTRTDWKAQWLIFQPSKTGFLRNSCLATFFVSVGYISVVFLIIMYLQGVRGLSPLNASLLLIPGYVVGALFSPIMGRNSDKIGARIIATVGIICLAAATLIYTVTQARTSFALHHLW